MYIELNDSLAGYNIHNMPEFDREIPLSTGVTQFLNFWMRCKPKAIQVLYR